MSNNPFRFRQDDTPDAGTAPGAIVMPRVAKARYAIGDVVRHRIFDFRGVVFDIDPVFDNTEEWYQAIPADVRPHKDQPFYHLLAENSESFYTAYVSEQNLEPDPSGEPIDHPELGDLFGEFEDGRYFLMAPIN